MMTIEEEIQSLVIFLSHPAGFNVDWGGLLTIRPISEDSPPSLWAVDWEETIDDTIFTNEKSFSSLQEAATFFVEKRHYLLFGLDFEKIMMGENHSEVEMVE
jgi:hypothetical protein